VYAAVLAGDIRDTGTLSVGIDIQIMEYMLTCADRHVKI